MKMKEKAQSVKRPSKGYGLDADNARKGYKSIATYKPAPEGNDGEYEYKPKDAAKNTKDDHLPCGEIDGKMPGKKKY